jgi:hypothetical protein
VLTKEKGLPLSEVKEDDIKAVVVMHACFSEMM